MTPTTALFAPNVPSRYFCRKAQWFLNHIDLPALRPGFFVVCGTAAPSGSRTPHASPILGVTVAVAVFAVGVGAVTNYELIINL